MQVGQPGDERPRLGPGQGEDGVGARHVDDEADSRYLLADRRPRGLRIEHERPPRRETVGGHPAALDVRGRRGPEVERAEVREVGDPDARAMLVLLGHRRRDEPAVALCERRLRRAEEALGRRAGDRMEAVRVPRERRREELEHAGHALSLSPAGSKNGPRCTRIATGRPSTCTRKRAPSAASSLGTIASPITFSSTAE